jgi:hypothetical protein
MSIVIVVANLCGPVANPMTGGDLGVGPVSSRRGLRIIDLDAGLCIVEC